MRIIEAQKCSNTSIIILYTRILSKLMMNYIILPFFLGV